MRIAPADLILIAIVMVYPFTVSLRRGVFHFTHAAFALMLTTSALVSVLLGVAVTSYDLVNKVLGFALLLGHYLMITNIVRSWSDLQRTLQWFIIGVVWNAAIAIAALLLARNGWIVVPQLNYGQRLSGLLVDPNAYGGLLVTTYALMLGTQVFRSARPARESGRVVDRVAPWILPIGIALTYSRSAWLAAVCMLFVFARLAPRQVRRVSVRAAFLAVAFIGVAGATFQAEFVQLSNRPEQVSGRLEILATAGDVFAANPLVGAGIGAVYREHGFIVHNTPAWLLAEFGMIGVLAGLGMILRTLNLAMRGIRVTDGWRKGAFMGLAAAHVAMAGLSLGIEALYQRHWWMVMALVVSARRANTGRSDRAGTYRRSEITQSVNVAAASHPVGGPGAEYNKKFS